MKNFLIAMLLVASIGISNADVIDTSGTISIGTPTEIYTEDQNPEEFCLAMNIYYESRSDNLAGKYAVADTVLNRVEDKRYPGTVCEVVRQAVLNERGTPVKHKCQFSWYCDGLPEVIANKEAWQDAQVIAYQMFQLHRYRGITEGSTHYHATYANPKWAPTLDYIGQIGSHIFYRWP